MVVVPWEQEKTIIPSTKFSFSINPNKLIKKQVLIFIVSDQLCLWVMRILEAQIIVNLEEGCTQLRLWMHHGIHM